MTPPEFAWNAACRCCVLNGLLVITAGDAVLYQERIGRMGWMMSRPFPRPVAAREKGEGEMRILNEHGDELCPCATCNQQEGILDYYKCEECGRRFDEFEMNYAAAQEDKKCLCSKCRAKAAHAAGGE